MILLKKIATHFNDLKILVQEKFVLFKLTIIWHMNQYIGLIKLCQNA